MFFYFQSKFFSMSVCVGVGMCVHVHTCERVHRHMLSVLGGPCIRCAIEPHPQPQNPKQI